LIILKAALYIYLPIPVVQMMLYRPTCISTLERLVLLSVMCAHFNVFSIIHFCLFSFMCNLTWSFDCSVTTLCI